jgi:hypothetical protein
VKKRIPFNYYQVFFDDLATKVEILLLLLYKTITLSGLKCNYILLLNNIFSGTETLFRRSSSIPERRDSIPLLALLPDDGQRGGAALRPTSQRRNGSRSARQCHQA